MKKFSLIFAILLLSLVAQSALAQLQLPKLLDYNNPPITYYNITDHLRYTEIDFTKQKVITSDGYKIVDLPFVVHKTAPEGELFWLLLYIPKTNNFQGWGIYTEDGKFICKKFISFKTTDGKYIIQTQEHLKQKVIAGKYYLKLMFSEQPTKSDIKISVAYSTQEIIDRFIDVLEDHKE